jgi:hypothetical protein
MLPEIKKFSNGLDPQKSKDGIDRYPDKEPDRYLNDIFNVDNITEHLTAIFTQLYLVHEKNPMEQLWEPLLNSFLYHEREEFSKDLRKYIFSEIAREISTNGKKGKERIKVPQVRKFYISMVVEFIKLFLRDHLIRQDEFETQEEYDKAVLREYGYYFMDVACHEFAIGKTFPLSGRIRVFDQNTIDTYGVQNAIMGIEDDNGEEFDFEVDKVNYKKYKEKFERVMGDRIFFEFMVTNVIGPNHAQGKILSSS